MKLTKYAAALVSLILLVSCSGKTAIKPVESFNAERDFAKANKLISEQNYTEARTLLLEIKNRDLTKKYAPLAELRIADSYVKEEQPDLAVAEYNKFLEMYPDNSYASYAQYQIAMVYFNQIESPERGYGGAQKALQEFEKLKTNFPRNPYREVVDLRIEKCRNTIADYEFLVGEFYMKKGSYNAAIGRYEGLLEKFPDYKKKEYVLLRLGTAYRKLGDREKAKEYLTRLVDKFPTSPLVRDAKKQLASLSNNGR
jgi:outer membrane protein assembly factor BamD